MIEISVVTASSGRRALLLAKLASLEAQTLERDRFEWVVCINGPEDGSEAALRSAPSAVTVTVIRHRAPLSPAAARNRAAGRARGSLLLISDDDCTHDPGCLAAHLSVQRGRGPAVVIGPVRLPEHLRVASRREPFERVATVGERVLWINATGTNTSVPTEAFAKVGGYDERFDGYGGEDPEFALRLKRFGLPFLFAPAAGVEHHGRTLGLEGERKAFQAGSAHWRVFRLHPRPDVGLLLGVHPLSLAVKRLLYNPLIARIFPHPQISYERAYLQGALAARRYERRKVASERDKTDRQQAER